MKAGKAQIFIVDDHPLVREWLTTLIQRQTDLAVCGEAEDSAQALRAIATAKPDVAVVDLALKSGSGLDLIKDLKQTCPAVAVVVLSMHDELLYAERAFRAGARGYVMKRDSTKKIVEAIRFARDGRRYMSERVAAVMAEKLVDSHSDNGAPVTLLSDRELAVFELLGQGQETSRIAASLHVSVKTVQSFYARIKEKFKIETERELVREAVRWHENRPNS